MRNPPLAIIAALGISTSFLAPTHSFSNGTRAKHSRDGSRATRASTLDGMMQSYKDTDVKLRGWAGAKSARRAKTKTLGLRHGGCAHMAWGN